MAFPAELFVCCLPPSRVKELGLGGNGRVAPRRTHTYTTAKICQRIEGYFGREESKDLRTTEVVMLQLDCGCI